MADAVWNVVGASVAGVSHIKAGLPCQDAHTFRRLPNGLLIAAVADGAGSASHAEIGAHIAVQAASETLERLTASRPPSTLMDCEPTAWETLLRDALQAARTALEAEADRQNIPLRELATTLLLLAATSTQIAAVQVGDGAIVGLDAESAVFAVTTPPEAEYANATTFLTSPDALQSAQFAHVARPVRALALFSDGLQRLALKLPEGTPHAPFFTPLFCFAAELANQSEADSFASNDATSDQSQAGSALQLQSFLRSPRITERADDDLTLLLAAWK